MIRETITNIDTLNFDTIVSNNENVLIMIKAPWCSSCNTVYPYFDELSKERKDITFGIISADENKEFCFDKLGVRKLPTYIYYVNGEQREFIVGPKTKNTILTDIIK